MKALNWKIASESGAGAPGLDSETWERMALNGVTKKRGKKRRNVSLLLVLGLVAFAAHAQSSLADSPERSILKGAAVEYLFPEQVTVTAGRPSAVEMHFRVGEGLHVNSHTPTQSFLIPTTVSIPESSGVRLESATYPEGEEFTLPVDPSTKLSVYTGEFTIHTSIVAMRGNHLVEAKLHYQACDKEACFPPKTITVPIDVIGK